MTKLRDRPGAGHFILSEATGFRSRQRITVGASQNLLAGAILAAIGLGPASATPGTASGPGNGAIGVWTADAGAPAGRWLIRVLTTGATATYEVRRPDGSIDGQGAVGSAYNGGINGTLADGATDWGAGAEIPMIVAYADGEVFVAHDPQATNGAQYASCVLFDDVVTGAAETVEAVSMARDCEVSEYDLVWSAHTDSQKAVALKALESRGILVRH